MFNLMRAHQRKILLVVTILTIIAFAFFYSYYDAGQPGAGSVARIYGREFSQSDFQREARKFQLALSLGLTDFAVSLAPNGSEENLTGFVINKLIVDHEGRKLGINPTDEEIKNAIVALPAFQTNGQFDPRKYQDLVTNSLAPRGFTELEIQHLIRSSLTLTRVKQLLDTGAAVTPAETTYLSRILQPVSGVAVLFSPADFRSGVKISDDQVSAAFKANATRYVTPEQRTLRYVAFPLPAEDPRTDAKARIEAQQKVANAADAFLTRASEIGLEKAATEAGLTVKTTAPFDQQGSPTLPAGLGDAAQAAAGPTAELAPAAFTLSPASPLTPVIEGRGQFLVGELVNVTPPRPQTVDEARPAITAELTEAAVGRAIEAAATDAAKKLRAAAQARQPAQAATAGLKTQPFTNASYLDPQASPDQRSYAQAALVLNEGEISALLPAADGAMLVWLEKRAPVDEKLLAEHGKELAANIASQRRNLLWAEWLQTAQRNADIVFPGRDNQG